MYKGDVERFKIKFQPLISVNNLLLMPWIMDIKISAPSYIQHIKNYIKVKAKKTFVCMHAST